MPTTLAARVNFFQGRGFTQEQAEIIALMTEAAILLFRRWPEHFILYGGANLILFHNSVRHSRDLDLLASSDQDLPDAQALAAVLIEGLAPISELLNLGQLKTTILIQQPAAVKVAVSTADNAMLFTVDLNRMGGSVLASAIEEHHVEAAAASEQAVIRSVSRDYQLLQKAEAFLFRSIVKARDAYDIHRLMNSDATLSGNLREHLEDSLMMHEVDISEIERRIAAVTALLCRAELKGFIPIEIYEALNISDFQPLRDAVAELFGDWL
jgi:hypothetical protein